MSLSLQEIKAEILTLPEQEQQKFIDFAESLRLKLAHRKVKPNKPLKLGLFKGKITMTDDFNEDLLC